MMLNVVKRAARVFLSRLSLLASVLMAWMNWQLHSSDNLDRLRVRGMDHLIFLNQERYFGIKKSRDDSRAVLLLLLLLFWKEKAQCAN